MKIKKCKYCNKEFYSTTKTRKLCDECTNYSKMIQFFKRYNIPYENRSLKEAYNDLVSFLKSFNGKNGLEIREKLGLNKNLNTFYFLYDNFKIKLDIKCPVCEKIHNGKFGKGIFCSEKCLREHVASFRDLNKLKNSIRKISEIKNIYIKSLKNREYLFKIENNLVKSDIFLIGN